MSIWKKNVNEMSSFFFSQYPKLINYYILLTIEINIIIIIQLINNALIIIGI